MNANQCELIYEEAQLLNYLNATKLPLGLIVNFGTPQLEWKRYANTKKPLMNANERETKNMISVNSRVFAVN